jgi:hypothetical protein
MTLQDGVRGGAAAGGRLALGLAVGATLLSAAGASAHAQHAEPPPPAAYALENVTVVRADGARTTDQTVIVRGGRIEAIGRGLPVPLDARVLTGDSLYVYPGLIDGQGTVRFEFPRDTTNRASVRSWDAPRVVQGFMPSRRVVDFLAATGTDGADLRKKGVVAVAVQPSPTDPLMPGRGAFVMLRRDATTPQQLLIEPVLPPMLTLRGGRGVYPMTVMAVVPWYRQLFLDAHRQAQLAQVASADPRVALPPAHDPDLAVVQEVLREGRVFFAANDAEEIRHVLRLSEEFRLRPVIVGGNEAWRVASELRARNVPVLVNVDFGTPRRWKPDAAPNGEAEPGVVREQRQFEERYRNAARLAEAGVTFALVSGGRGDLLAGARKAVEYGLPEAAALRALTAAPATIYGVPNMVRVEAGMPATFIVADRPLFEKEARVVYTFVEGSLERGAEQRARRDAAGAVQEGGDAPAGDIIQVAGTWRFEITGPMSQDATVRLAQEGTTLSGTMEGIGGSLSLTGTIEGERLTLHTTVTMGGQSIPLTFVGTVRGNEASGTVDTPMGGLDWTARRIDGGEAGR